MLRGRGFQQRAVDLGLDVHRQEPREDLLRLWLEDEVAVEQVVLALLLVGPQQVLREREDVEDRHALHERRDERVVDDRDPIDLAFREKLGQAVRDRLRVGVPRLIREPGELAEEPIAPEPERACRLAADGHPADLLSFASEVALERGAPADHLRVEGAGEAAVARDRHERHRLHRVALLEERDPADGRARPGGAGHQLEHPVGVRAHRLDSRLRLAELRSRNELERARDLPRVRDGADPPADVLRRRYETNASSCSTANVCRNFCNGSSSFATVSSDRSPVSRISL